MSKTKNMTIQERIAKVNGEMFLKFNLELQFRNRIYGGLPKSKEVIKGWIEAKGLDEETVTKDLDMKGKFDLLSFDEITDGEYFHDDGRLRKAA
ncbi:TPA: hypothetical protein HA278_06860 [Candidatus Woesearchaeota archaeon]|nr:hypothetical protein [Candidatus Woesearchaeota archaeon]